MTSFTGQTGQIMGQNWDTCGTAWMQVAAKGPSPFSEQMIYPVPELPDRGTGRGLCVGKNGRRACHRQTL